MITPSGPKGKGVRISLPMFASSFVRLTDLFVNTGEYARAFERVA